MLERIYLESRALKALIDGFDRRNRQKKITSRVVEAFAERFRSHAKSLIGDIRITQGDLQHAGAELGYDPVLTREGITAQARSFASFLLKEASRALRGTPVGKKVSVTFKDGRPPIKGVALMAEGVALRVATKIDDRRCSAKSCLLHITDPGIRKVNLG